jgi:hypothetical protein
MDYLTPSFRCCDVQEIHLLAWIQTSVIRLHGVSSCTFILVLKGKFIVVQLDR